MPDTGSYQPYPTTGRLAANMNLSLADLRQIVDPDDAVLYYYIVDSVDEGGDGFVQGGSGPNWQGDLLTLCSCKHKMRTYPALRQGAWVAGVTGRDNTFDHGHYLVYLMCVEHAFASQRKLWVWLTEVEQRAKNARYNVHGDVYEPTPHLGDALDPLHYERPHPLHVHCGSGDWKAYIHYTRGHGKPLLLVGDQQMSYLWNCPLIRFQATLTQGERRTTIKDFLHLLK